MSTVNLPELPRDTALRGETAGLWAVAILEGLDAPRSNVNCYAMSGWFLREGGGGQNNPMNTTLDAHGATGEINSVGVRNFDTPADGVAATVDTLHSYPAIVVSLRADHGLTGAGVAGELSRWSGGGYDSILPAVVPLPPVPATGTFTAALELTEAGRWSVHGTRSKAGATLGGPDTWQRATVEVNRSTGEWRTV